MARSKKRNRAGKTILIILITLIIAAASVGALWYFGVIDIPVVGMVMDSIGIQREEQIVKLCNSYAQDYDVVSENEDGTLTVSVTAPDFLAVLLTEDETGTLGEINESILEDLIDKYPDLTKDYEFTVTEASAEEIEAQFRDQVAYDLIMFAISQVDMSDYKGVEE